METTEFEIGVIALLELMREINPEVGNHYKHYDKPHSSFGKSFTVDTIYEDENGNETLMIGYVSKDLAEKMEFNPDYQPDKQVLIKMSNTFQPR